MWDLIRVFKGWPYEKVVATYWRRACARKAQQEYNKGRFKHIVRKRSIKSAYNPNV